ncbi:2-dehydropantoate 2-reductase [Methylomarinum sp. Ch1-1]|uniref:2-dehydropantoate 2-reductase n=1 Tax=Methylomarinum roseum TaxID=3067653 RepID=A0AAU7NUZ4_9GAMM|nr:2-dehydropantoate 2-reductase [Methylomarinum sp. Ch1-1]MDP4519077.1 2-dehydropantoate 2-reductase [Methylomarinum sp. Ch1-1]
MQDKVLIVGAGAIGAFYGALLAKAGAEVAVACRSDYQIVKRQGYQIISASLGDWTFLPSQVVKTTDDYQGQADYLILCTKMTADIDRAEIIRAAVSPQTTIVFIQNGVETEQELLDAFPDNEIVSGLAFICCNRLQPGQISHLAYGKLTLGQLPAGIGDKTRHLAELFNQSGIDCVAMDDIITGRWTKCVWNAPFNPLSVLSGGLATQDIVRSQESFIRAIMHEVCAIAAACGHPLAENVVDLNIQSTYKMPPYRTSMLLDFENGQPMETEVILGNAVRAGEREHIACPNLKALYALMKLRELKIAESKRQDKR